MKHSYISGKEKVYEPKEVEIARECEIEDIIGNFQYGTMQYDVKVNGIQHKYGKDDDEDKDAIGTFEYGTKDYHDIGSKYYNK